MNYSHLVFIIFGLSTSFLYQNVNALSGEKIVGGDHATEGQFKYQVSLQVDDFHTCGGGIIGNQYILTAAHCVIDPKGRFKDDQLVVLAGALESNTTDSSVVRVKVDKAYVPQEYNPVRPASGRPYRTIGDIAVLKLKKGLRLRGNTKLEKLKLPTKIDGDYSDYTNEKAIIAGFGDNWVIMGVKPNSTEEFEVRSGSYNKMKFAESTVILQTDCSSVFTNPIYDTHICAAVTQRNSEEHEGICAGDSGGLLVYNGETVIGVASTSPVGCREDQNPAVYTRVSAYKSFIENAMKNVKTNSIRVKSW